MEQVEQLLDQGHKPIPLQWVDIDKNENVVLMLLRCSEVDWSAVEIWRKPLV